MLSKRNEQVEQAKTMHVLVRVDAEDRLDADLMQLWPTMQADYRQFLRIGVELSLLSQLADDLLDSVDTPSDRSANGLRKLDDRIAEYRHSAQEWAATFRALRAK